MRIRIDASDTLKYLSGISRTFDIELPRMFRDIVYGCKRFAVSITHVDTGFLKSQHMIEGGDLLWTLYNDTPYAEHEHDRGGTHSFYDRTVTEYYPRGSERAITRFMERL